MHYLSILAIMKNEAMNLKLWIDHYIWQGVEHFYIIDNNSDDTSVQIIEDLINNGYPITLYKLYEKYKQTEHYRYVYDKENLQEKTKWLIVADLDEFFYCNNSKISNELKHFEDYDLIISYWRMFGSNNCIEHPKDIRISLTKRVKEYHYMIKYIFQTKNIYSGALGIHELNYGYNNKIDLSEIFRLNHYTIQSKEFFEKVKMTRGAADLIENENVRDWNYFDKYNDNTDYEDNDLKNMILNKMHYLSILTIMKNEAMNLKLWIDHYIWQGVDHFYIIDNNSTDVSVQIIEDLINNGYPITLYKLFEQHKQVEHYKYVYNKENLQEKTKWLIVADLDEFFYCNNSKISNELLHFEDYDLITSKWRMFGSNNCIEHPKDIRTSLTKRVEELHINTKYIFQTKNIYSEALNIHELNYGYSNNKIDLSEIFRLNHYTIQSKEYFEKVKMTRGDVSNKLIDNIRDWNYFDAYNQNNDCEDNDLKNMVLMVLNNDLKNMVLNNTNTNTNITNTNKNYYWTIILIFIFICIILLFIYNFIIRS